MDQTKTPLFDAIRNFAKQSPTSFYIPGHKMGQGISDRWLEIASKDVFKMDLSEVYGLDDFHCPQGVIKEAQELAADAWGAKKSFFLINGTSAGIIAAICTSVKEGQTIAVPRNAHKSVTAALTIGGAVPKYLIPEYDAELGLICGLKPKELENAYEKNDIKAVFGVTPSYHGICSDVKTLADITHKNGGIYIADEAHASHVYFSDKLPEGGLVSGADISCQSTHKMAGSLTQSSMLHVNSDKVDLDYLGANLTIMQSTSPSYILMASLDLARSFIALNGKKIFDELYDVVISARKEIKKLPGIKILDDSLVGHNGIFAYEPMRLVFSASELGIDGYALRRILHDEYNIEVEYSDYTYALCVLGIGSTEEDIEKLVCSLKEISLRYSGNDNQNVIMEKMIFPDLPEMRLTPREAWKAEKERISWQNSVGRICAEMIVPYPPGIPIIYPGEIITNDIWNYLENQRVNKWHMHSADEGKLEYINVIK